MKRTLSKTAASTAAIALIATPAFAAGGPGQSQGQANQGKSQGKGQMTSPAKLCKTASKKKAEGQKKSPFAACVSGAKKAQREMKANEQRQAEGEQPKPTTAPGQLCRTQPRKKVAGQRKSLFAMCVKGVNTARQQAKRAEQEQEQEQPAPTTQS